jgi:hypothetical protein
MQQAGRVVNSEMVLPSYRSRSQLQCSFAKFSRKKALRVCLTVIIVKTYEEGLRQFQSFATFCCESRPVAEFPIFVTRSNNQPIADILLI